MYFRLSIRKLFYRLVLWLLCSAVVGYFLGFLWPVIATTCLSLLVWHYRHLYQLVKWLWQSKSLSPPESSGIWGRIYDGLYRLIRQNRKKQKSLNEKIRRFRDGAEALPDAALVLSSDLAILWGNKKAQHILGIHWPGDMGLRIDNLIRFPEFTQYLEEGKFSAPCQITSPVNNDLKIELRMMPYGVEQILLLARDISKIHKLEEMRRDFVANVSHELKTPLTVVRGYVEMIQTTEHALDPHWKKAFLTMEDQVSRMDRLVEQLLVLSKVEIKRELDNSQTVNMPKLISALIEDATWLNENKQHTIEIEIDEHFGVKGIETELKSACSNLLSNAISYTEPKGKIKVSWQYSDGKMTFSVQDNGPGIKPEHVNRLTERFYRIDKSRSRDTGGSGLGLAIVKHVLQHHNAELTIKSEWGKGSEFAISFQEKVVL